MNKETCLGLGMIFLMACQGKHKDSHGKFFTGTGPSRGHEDITRFAVENVNRELEGRLGPRYFPDIARGASGTTSDNPLLRGNYESDFPSQKMRDFYEADRTVDWHHEGRLQAVHGLRNHRDGVFQSTREACESHRSFIKRAAIKGFWELKRGDPLEGYYWIGHATHIIQDGFSEAHIRRSGRDGRRIESYCTYGKKISGMCYHAPLDSRDSVWHDGLHCLFDPSARRFDCLKDEARWAVLATMSFLETVALNTEAEAFEIDLDAFFDIPEKEGMGYFHCDESSP